MKARHNRNSIYRKLQRVFLIVLVVPVLVLGAYMVWSDIQFVRNERLYESDKLLEQNILDIENRMKQCESSLTYAASNYSFQEFLQMDGNDNIELYRASRSVAPMLYNVQLSNAWFKKLHVYTDKTYSVMGDLLKPASEVSNEPWYAETLATSQICWWRDGARCFLTKKIETSYPVKAIGVLRADVKESMLSGSMAIFETVPVRVMLGEDVICQQQDWKDGYYTREMTLMPSGWQLRYEINRDYFYPDSVVTIATPVLLILLVLGLAAVLLRLALNRLVGDVDSLVTSVESVRGGNLEVSFPECQTDELNLLASSMEAMLGRIRELIDKVTQDEQEQKEMEVELLRSKINPHFLYNNLSAINWLAIDKGDDDIYEITTQMAAFYRSALNKGKVADRLQLEITNIKAYVNLQLMAHDGEFDVAYDIEEDALNCVIPTFILQPLVENALEHGVDLLREGRGRIVIRGYLQGRDLYLEVVDNGRDLFEKIGNHELPASQFGYGTGNVHKRVQLSYGPDYGLRIWADETGTTARLRLRADDASISA